MQKPHTKINFISNQSLHSISGGWSGINYNIHQQLESYFDINYIGPVSPPSLKYEKLVSKINRIAGLKGNFHFFSDNRLNLIKEKVHNKLLKSKYNFYFGQTPWIKCNNEVPYGTYMDAAFPTYMDIYSSPKKFRKKDLLRIAKTEEKWLQKADNIFIGSEWAWHEMVKHYDIDEKKKVVVHTGGNIDIPEKQTYSGGLNFVFISLDFEKKGGFICVNTFKKIQNQYPQATLTILGEKPPKEVLNIQNIIYAGFLRKTNPDELSKFTRILSEAFLLIHPTTMDTMGAVLIEAAYYGCPSIAPSSFGVPELVIHNKTGIIVKVPFTDSNFYNEIKELIENKEKYLTMRQNVWDFSRNKFTWNYIGNIIRLKINNH